MTSMSAKTMVDQHLRLHPLDPVHLGACRPATRLHHPWKSPHALHLHWTVITNHWTCPTIHHPHHFPQSVLKVSCFIQPVLARLTLISLFQRMPIITATIAAKNTILVLGTELMYGDTRANTVADTSAKCVAKILFNVPA